MAARAILTLPLLLILLPLLAALGKALNVDDPLFVWVAQHLHRAPLDPYGFTANWFGYPAEMWRMNVQNPPLTSYWLALAGLLSFEERVLHLSLLPFALLTVAGTMRLARQFDRSPLFSGILCAASPVLLISSTTLMCDVMMLAAMVWAVTLWVEGLAEHSLPRLLLSALLCAAAPLTKYFGLSLLPLLLCYTLLRAFLPRARRPALLLPLPALLIPALAVLAWHFYSEYRYGVSHIIGAAIYARAVHDSPGYDGTLAAFASMTFLGGCLIWPLLLWLKQARWPGRLLILLPAAALGPWGYRYGTELRTHIPFHQHTGGLPLENQLLAAVFFAAGLCALALAARALLRRPRCPETWLLALWFGGTVVFFSLINWTVAARNVLPLVPPLCILAAPRREEGDAAAPWRAPAHLVSAGLGLIFALWGAHADVRWANAVRADAERVMKKYGGKGRPVYFMGHWGFQHYMERHGATAAIIDPALGWAPPDNALLVIPSNNTNVYWAPFHTWVSIEILQRRASRALSLQNFLHGAGFYSHLIGPMPMLLASGVVDAYTIAEPGPPDPGAGLRLSGGPSPPSGKLELRDAPRRPRLLDVHSRRTRGVSM